MSTSGLSISLAQAADLPDVLTALDAEFVTGKGRSLSLKDRFPSVYGEGSPSCIFVAQMQNQLAGTVATKKRVWVGGDHPSEIVMVGGVYTAPSYRGLGIGRRLLQEAADDARRQGAAAAVLWTGIHAYYEKAGWQTADIGRFGRLLRAPSGIRAEAPQRTESAVARVEELRIRHQRSRLIRQPPRDYEAIPLPAVETRVCFSPDGLGYALYGVLGSRAFAYEIVGAPASIPCLLASLAHHHEEVWINDHHGSVLSAWTTGHPGYVEWSEQRQTMWLTWPGGWILEDAAKVCISYFDRI